MISVKSFTTLTSGLVVFGQSEVSDVLYRITPGAAATVTLPAAASEHGRVVRVSTGANAYTVTVNTLSGDFIAISGGGATATSISNTSVSYATVTFLAVSDSVWQVLDVTGVTSDFA